MNDLYIPQLQERPWFAVNIVPKSEGDRYTEIELSDGTLNRSIHVRDQDLPGDGSRLSEREVQDMDALFVAKFPAGWGFADQFQEKDGDFKKIGFMSYESFEIDIYDERSQLLPRVKSLMSGFKVMKGKAYPVDACGHTVQLGVKA